MKKILLIIAIAFISISAKAQDIAVSGITLGATKNDAIKILNEKKYKYRIEGSLNYILVSPYTNNLSTAINQMMISFNSDNIVISILLISKLDVKIFDNYDNIVSKLKEKYGKPWKVIEKYYSPYSENYRNYPLSAIEYLNKHETDWKINDYTYLDVFITKSGIDVFYSDTRFLEKENTTDY
jgi:hypothetical protein